MYQRQRKLKTRRFKQFMPRSAGAALAVLLLIGGISYAALTSQRTVLKGNTIQTAIASLQVSDDGGNYSSIANGYTFSALIPGGPAMPHDGFPIYIRNVGTSTLALNLSATAPTTVPQGVDLKQVNVILTPKSGGASQSFSLQSLIDADTNTDYGGDGLALNMPGIQQNEIQEYTLQVKLGSDVVNGANFGLTNIDFSFGGTAVATESA